MAATNNFLGSLPVKGRKEIRWQPEGTACVCLKTEGTASEGEKLRMQQRGDNERRGEEGSWLFPGTWGQHVNSAADLSDAEDRLQQLSAAPGTGPAAASGQSLHPCALLLSSPPTRRNLRLWATLLPLPGIAHATLCSLSHSLFLGFHCPGPLHWVL